MSPAEPAADSAATAQEAAWELVESAWAVMEFLALVCFRVVSSEVEVAQPAIYNNCSARRHKIERFLSSARK
jgi:hypothetical protein